MYANEDFYGDDNKIIYKKGDLIDYKFTDKEGKIIFKKRKEKKKKS